MEILPTLAENSVDSVCCDPPYHLQSITKRFANSPRSEKTERYAAGPFGRHAAGFMGQSWDGGDIAMNPETWGAVLRVLKPGGHLVAFGGTRTHHRIWCAIEDAGFEVRDTIMWVYGCLDEETQLVTPNGVEPYHSAVVGDLVLCYDAPSGAYSYQPILEVVAYDYDDTAYRIIGDFGEQIVSRNHRCIVERDGNEVFQLAEKTARQRTARVPILEDLPALQGALRDTYQRTWRGHRSAVVRIVPFRYVGKVWCLRVPTGAFVAVRGGVAFPTGNSGFPKSHGAGDGWGTALKPAFEPIILARKPLSEKTVAANMAKWGTGALNIDGCRVPVDPEADASQIRTMQRGHRTEDTSGQVWGLSKNGADAPQVVHLEGRWPANLILSWREDEYEIRGNVTADERRELYRWLSENA